MLEAGFATFVLFGGKLRLSADFADGRGFFLFLSAAAAADKIQGDGVASGILA
jgi:hypothetical protein